MEQEEGGSAAISFQEQSAKFLVTSIPPHQLYGITVRLR